ncbi:M3 family metallopeptidase [Streptomyces sp. NPDC101150]|uniref:M3 family metallopeptidase n=1 Tax=Streptomyces sp. NPDC101150 TaxID=3366114 RepID=UPI00382B7078
MTVDAFVIPDRESLSAMEDTLAGMMTRLQEIVSGAQMTQDHLIEVTSMYNNVAYIFLYLEANDAYVNFERLLPWRDAFHSNPDLDRRILEMLTQLRCPDHEAEESRLAYIDQLTDKLQGSQDQASAELETLLASARTVMSTIQADQIRLLERLGVPKATLNPSAVFYKMSASSPSVETRSKLARAWAQARDTHTDEFLAAIDRMIDKRREHSEVRGFATVLDRTLQACSIDAQEVEAFLDRYMRSALEGHALLEQEIRDVLGPVEQPMAHFAHYLQMVSGAVKPPLFDLDGCLDYIFAVVHRVFGLAVVRVEADSSEHVLAVDVHRGGLKVGRINFDLWDVGSKTIRANYTKGIRNRTEWTTIIQRPVAYVSCRFQGGPGGGITFQNVHSLFHEFGHAVNHLLIRKRVSNRSGLEYLPLERLEHLSMWFEKWVYHPQFAAELGLSEQQSHSLELCRRIKMLEYRRTYAERAITAALDFEVHRSPHSGLAAAYARLDERYGISKVSTLGDFLPYFTWPMFTANPGANFAYLFGAADSSENFARFQCFSLDDVGRHPHLKDLFSTCFDFEEPTRIPDVAATFAFYDQGGQGLLDSPLPSETA